ncbi:MAG: hypothetical protein ACE5I7_00640 [Candidatus Binatia bacterium]
MARVTSEALSGVAGQDVTGALAAATFRFRTDAPELARYARAHLATLVTKAGGPVRICSTLRWHEGQPPRDRTGAFPELASMERIDRDLYIAPGRLCWFRIDDLRDLHLYLSWREDRLTVEGDFYYRLASDWYRDRAKRVLYPRRVGELRRRRFTTLLYYLVYYPCWWWLEETQDLHPIHAAGVRTSRSGILLGGASGVGKSTLAVALASLPGAKLLSDSFVLHNGADMFAVPEPILLDAWSRQWLGSKGDELEAIDWRYCLNRTGYRLPTFRLAADGRAGLLLFPRRSPETYVKPISSEQAHERLSAADLIINDLRRYWAFAAVVEHLVPGRLVARREAQLARLTAAVPGYEIGLKADATCTATVGSILELVADQQLRTANARQ